MNRIDFKINSLISYILQILVICSILCVLPVFQEILSVRLSERILALIGFCTCSIFFCRYHSLLDKVGWVYCISLLVISIVHTDMVTVENTFMSSVRWLNIFLLILLYKNLNLNTRWLLYFAFVFYITECGICIIEKLGKFYVIDYSMADSMQATNAKAYQYTFMDFRSRGLLLHPLYNANVISIFMGYILVSSRLKRYFQIILLFTAFFSFLLLIYFLFYKREKNIQKYATMQVIGEVVKHSYLNGSDLAALPVVEYVVNGERYQKRFSYSTFETTTSKKAKADVFDTKFIRSPYHVLDLKNIFPIGSK